jgi:tetratricopeptide (TPR) repeat protein
MRWGVALLVFMLPSIAHADGAVAVGFGVGETLVTTSAISKSSSANARSRALADCGQLGRECKIVHEFKDVCVATILFNDRLLDVGTGTTSEDAEQDALRQCRAKGSACTTQYVACDPAPATAATEPVIPPATVPVPDSPQPLPRTVPTEPTGPVISWSGIFWFLFLTGGAAYGAYLVRNKYFSTTLPEVVEVNENPTQTDTASARRHVLAAWDYLQKAIVVSKGKLTTETIEEIYRIANEAAEHLVKARNFDPDVQVEDEVAGNYLMLSQPALTAMLLSIRAGCEVHLARIAFYRYHGRRHLLRAVSALLRAIEYEAQPLYYARLAEAYAFLGEQHRAHENIKKAIDLAPDSPDIAQIEQSIPKIREMHPRSRYFELQVFIAIVFGGCTLLALIATITGAFSPDTRRILYYLGTVPWFAIIVYLILRNKLRGHLKQMWWTYSYFINENKIEKKRAFIHELHAKRWRAWKSPFQNEETVWQDI